MGGANREILEFEEKTLFEKHAQIMEAMLDQESREIRELLLKRCEFLASKIRSVMRAIDLLSNRVS